MFNPEPVIADVLKRSAGKKIWIAYSGGVDSHVLLHALATSHHPELTELNAVHIDHGLQSGSAIWAEHCALVCDDLNVNFQCIRVKVTDIDVLGLEAAARKARYDAITNLVSKNDVVLTAQHQHDQAETLLLQLLRGAGPKGLSAMASQSKLGDVTLIRPLLNISQTDIVAYAQQHQLQWMEDPSNVETRWNRNYIRHNVWPVIEQRWPSAAKTLSRSAQHCAEANELMTELAQQDLNTILNDKGLVSISALLSLSVARQRNVLRYHIESQKFSLPSTSMLQRVLDEVCSAAADKTPLVSWMGVEVRRYQDDLYFMLPLNADSDVEYLAQCLNTQAMKLPSGEMLAWQCVIGEGLTEKVFLMDLNVRFRRGGERILIAGQNQHKSLKHLFQEWQIPPWQREHVPLLFCGNELVAVVGYAYAAGYVALAQERGFIPFI